MKKLLFISMITLALASCGNNTTENTTTTPDSGSTGTSDTGLNGNASAPSPASTGIANGVAPTTGVGADSVGMGTSKGVKSDTGSSTQDGSKPNH